MLTHVPKQGRVAQDEAPRRRVMLTLPDTRSEDVRRRIAEQSARLDAEEEREAMAWIESVSEFDEPDAE